MKEKLFLLLILISCGKGNVPEVYKTQISHADRPISYPSLELNKINFLTCSIFDKNNILIKKIHSENLDFFNNEKYKRNIKKNHFDKLIGHSSENKLSLEDQGLTSLFSYENQSRFDFLTSLIPFRSEENIVFCDFNFDLFVKNNQDVENLNEINIEIGILDEQKFSKVSSVKLDIEYFKEKLETENILKNLNFKFEFGNSEDFFKMIFNKSGPFFKIENFRYMKKGKSYYFQEELSKIHNSFSRLIYLTEKEVKIFYLSPGNKIEDFDQIFRGKVLKSDLYQFFKDGKKRKIQSFSELQNNKNKNSFFLLGEDLELSKSKMKKGGTYILSYLPLKEFYEFFQEKMISEYKIDRKNEIKIDDVRVGDFLEILVSGKEIIPKLSEAQEKITKIEVYRALYGGNDILSLLKPNKYWDCTYYFQEVDLSDHQDLVFDEKTLLNNRSKNLNFSSDHKYFHFFLKIQEEDLQDDESLQLKIQTQKKSPDLLYGFKNWRDEKCPKMGKTNLDTHKKIYHSQNLESFSILVLKYRPKIENL